MHNNKHFKFNHSLCPVSVYTVYLFVLNAYFILSCVFISINLQAKFISDPCLQYSDGS